MYRNGGGSVNGNRSDVLQTIRRQLRPSEGVVPTFIHSDPEVYRLELGRIFQRAWLFVAHASEIAAPGDFVQRQMGEQSVVVSRGSDGQIHTLLNLCRHRGMQVVCEDSGSRKVHRCPYHGFAYDSAGGFVGAPFQRDAYPDGIDPGAFHLVEARTEVYRGLVFATWDPQAPALSTWLGAMSWYLDILVGRAEMEVVGVAQRWMVPTGWKFPSENFCSDAYHTATTHAFLSKLGMVDDAAFGRDGYHVDAGGGHGLGIGTQDDGPWYPDELRGEFEVCLKPDQLDLFDRVKNFHGNVFPNLSFLIPNVIKVGEHKVSGTTLRQWQPAGPDKVQVWSWYLVERSAPDWWKELGRATYVQTFGSSGMFEQDDTENWELQTKNANATLVRNDVLTLDYSMGLGAAPLDDFPGPGSVFAGKFNEAAARNFYQQWASMMLEDQ